jgi:DNA polymerase II small subunit
MVLNKSVTKNGTVVLTLEDPTGQINVMITKSKPELYDLTNYIVLDEVLGITGMSSGDVVFANSIIFPDIPTHEFKKSPNDENIAILGDIHIGSKHFLYDEFSKMIKWLKGEFGTPQQKEDAKKVKYLILIGDLVDGVGIYPAQENDLEIPDIEAQYTMLASYLQKIPEEINIIICAGNHDAVRIAEPQPQLPKDFAKALWDMPNVTMVSNPAIVNIGATDTFSGFSVLLYHGFSFPYYADSVEPLRLKGGLENVNAIMEFLLKKRHLAPSHTSTQYIPDERDDPLVIKSIPDFFISGHIHTTSITNYKNITLVNSSTWIGMTDFQEKIGLHPHPARVPLINLKTRQAKVMKFESDK